MTKTSRRAKASRTTTTLGKQTASTSAQSPQRERAPSEIAHDDAVRLAKEAMKQFRDAVELLSTAHSKLFGYEHHALMRDTLQLAAWNMYEANRRTSTLLNTIYNLSNPTLEQPTASAF
jgi:hypothetical protein